MLASSSLFLHIISGSIALISGAIAIFSSKGQGVHRRAGRIYFWAMTLVFLSGLVLSVYRYNRFLFLLAFLSYYSAFAGIRSLSLRQLHQGQAPQWYDWAAGLINAVANLLFLGLGAYWLWEGQYIAGGMSVGFALGGLAISHANLHPFIQSPTESNQWYQAHIGNMMGSYIATFTAFLSTTLGSSGLINPYLLFVLPSLIGVPMLLYWQRKNR